MSMEASLRNAAPDFSSDALAAAATLRLGLCLSEKSSGEGRRRPADLSRQPVQPDPHTSGIATAAFLRFKNGGREGRFQRQVRRPPFVPIGTGNIGPCQSLRSVGPFRCRLYDRPPPKAAADNICMQRIAYRARLFPNSTPISHSLRMPRGHRHRLWTSPVSTYA